jgi:hypothetical protein
MAHRTTWLLVLGLAIAAAPACRQVLGLEEAKREEAIGAAGGPAAPSTSIGDYCEKQPTAACTQCLSDCGGFGEECSSDPACAGQLDDYNVCLGSRCEKDPDKQEACTFDLDDGPRTCAVQCQDECSGTRLISDCEVYCACMEVTCASELPSNCITECGKLEPEVARCRRNHCGTAAISKRDDQIKMHCLHASGTRDICAGTVDLAPKERNICLDKNENFWACNKPSDCCSDNCVDGSCLP